MTTQTASKNAAIDVGSGGKKRITVGISDMKVSSDPDSFLITHSLGPCIGLIVYDPKRHTAALLHYQLPTAKGHEQRARENPHMFADTAIPLLFQQMGANGASKEHLVVGVFGGASMLQDNQIFKIGIQNTRAAKKLLWQQCVPVKHEDVGGHASRTVDIDVGTGRIRLQKEGHTYLFN